MKSYEELLERLYKELPEKAKEKARFKMPQFEVIIQGNTTIITNFVDVAEKLRRDPKHLLKYLTKESGAAANIDRKRLLMKGRFREKALNKKLEAYIREFVLCKECGKPDTTIITQDKIQYLRCEACGARSPIPTLK
ncbi:MAG: translation initiation factor IF-2 subunit beta [Candidatus Diapherotrites archaeon]|nr:translation initiation factor IF-2 subunit beta [Candidatus Diapherotrites archaeon]